MVDKVKINDKSQIRVIYLSIYISYDRLETNAEATSFQSTGMQRLLKSI